jgi:hypothetical protein
VGVIEDLSVAENDAMFKHNHPIDRYSVEVAFQNSGMSINEVGIVLSLWDTCFQNQDPDNYEQDWGSGYGPTMRMYRGVSHQEIDILADVVSAAHDVSFSAEDVRVVVRSHTSYVGRKANGDTPDCCLVVWHPDHE